MKESKTPAPAADQAGKTADKPVSIPGRKSNVLRNGFSIPGAQGYSGEVPGRLCPCGFQAFPFTKICPKCGRDLKPDQTAKTE
jgi:hypothetical protein